tara:strand:- start:1205 stop:1582 length:378 start_codon:yes stop_codon:yes gene_type:complete
MEEKQLTSKELKIERQKKYPNRCTECFQNYNRNYYNEYRFDLDLWNRTRTLDDWSQFHGHDRLNIKVLSYIGNSRGHHNTPCSTWSLYIDEDLGEKEVCVGEDMPIEQLERLYEFLKTALNKEGE